MGHLRRHVLYGAAWMKAAVGALAEAEIPLTNRVLSEGTTCAMS